MTHNALGHRGLLEGGERRTAQAGDTNDVFRTRRRGMKTCSNDRFAASGLDRSCWSERRVKTMLSNPGCLPTPSDGSIFS